MKVTCAMGMLAETPTTHSGHAAPKFEEPPWTTGTLKVNAEPLTEAIQWLAAQLRRETEARQALESRFEAFGDGVSMDSEGAALPSSGQDGEANFDTANEKTGDSLYLKEEVERLSRAVQSLQDQLALPAPAELAEPTGSSASAHLDGARAALQAQLDALDGKFSNMTAQLDALDGKFNKMTEDIGACNDELAILRAAPGAFTPTPTSTLAGSENCSGVGAQVAISNGDGLGAHDPDDSALCKGVLNSGEGGASAWLDKPKDNKEHLVEVSAQHTANSRRPSVCSTVTGGPDSVQGGHVEPSMYQYASYPEKQSIPDGFVAWVEKQISTIHGDMADIGILVKQSLDGNQAECLRLDDLCKSETCHQGVALDPLQGALGAAQEKGELASAATNDHSLNSRLHHEALQRMADSKTADGFSMAETSEKLKDELRAWLKEQQAVIKADLTDLLKASSASALAMEPAPTHLAGLHERMKELESSLAQQRGLSELAHANGVVETEDSNVSDIDCNVPPTRSFGNAESGDIATILERLRMVEENIAASTDGSHARRAANNASGDIAKILERMRMVEENIASTGDVSHAVRAANGAKEGLKRLDVRLQALENRSNHGLDVGASVKIGVPAETQKRDADYFRNDSGRSSTDDVLKMLQDMKHMVTQAYEEAVDAKREIGNVSLAVKGVQRNVEMTTSKLEDTATAQEALKARMDVALPHLLRALESLARQIGPDGLSCDVTGDVEGNLSRKQPLDVDALRDLISSNRLPELFVSPDMLKRAVETLSTDVKTKLGKLHQNMTDISQKKADNEDLRCLVSKLGAVENDMHSCFAAAEAQIVEDGVENPAGARWPLQPARCISCNAKAELVAPWERKVVPKGPFPQRQWPLLPVAPNNYVHSASPVPGNRGRRRDTSLPAIDREGSNAKLY